jgi:hypothetical protein
MEAQWQPVTFVFIVDDFGVEYIGQRHVVYLIETLRTSYMVTTDWSGEKYAGIAITWDYTKRTCQTTMNRYINNVQVQFGHQDPKKPEHLPHKHQPIQYGAKEQYSNDEVDTSPKLDVKGVKRVQGITGAILYYAHAVDNKLLLTLNSIGIQQAATMENPLKEVNKLLNYVATYPSDGTKYRASSMILAAHSDASFLIETRPEAGWDLTSLFLKKIPSQEQMAQYYPLHGL